MLFSATISEDKLYFNKCLKVLLFAALFLTSLYSAGQSPAALIHSEPNDLTKKDLAEWKKLKEDVNISFATKDIRYSKNKVPSLKAMVQDWKAEAWKGEKVNTQFLIWSGRKINNVNFKIGDLCDNKGNKINAQFIKANFVRYVLTDGLNAQNGGCGIQKNHDSSIVADVIDDINQLSIEKTTTQPVWLSISIPPETPEGMYHTNMKVMEGASTLLKNLNISIQVINKTLPPSNQWTFHLDLWQNPYSSARIYNVKPWTKEHFDVMRPEMKRLAEAGQKAITASIIHDPWNGQTYDIYQSMIQWQKRKDGTWQYDYSIFDQWVTYMTSLGIDKIINCYSLIPWNLKFYYFDEATEKDTFLIAKPGTTAYNIHWQTMLADFARHLKEKKWFEKTSIAMDERPLEDMIKAIDLIKSTDKDFKISLAGNYHKEIEEFITDYSVASNQVINAGTLLKRKNQGKITTYYTCCTEGFPNTFTFSPPAESAWLAIFSEKKGFDGYLRWAYNCWPKNALVDSRFGTWSAGDAFLVYPGNRSSIRFERLIEGIQDYEKIQFSRKYYTEQNQHDKLTKLIAALAPFELNTLTTQPASEAVENIHQLLNTF